MPDPSTPLTFDELSKVFWFPVEDPDNPDCEITQIYEHLFQNVLGEGGGKQTEGLDTKIEHLCLAAGANSTRAKITTISMNKSVSGAMTFW